MVCVVYSGCVVVVVFVVFVFLFFFFNDTATTEIYTLSLHDALSISSLPLRVPGVNSQDRRRWVLGFPRIP